MFGTSMPAADSRRRSTEAVWILWYGGFITTTSNLGADMASNPQMRSVAHSTKSAVMMSAVTLWTLESSDTVSSRAARSVGSVSTAVTWMGPPFAAAHRA